MPRQILTSWTLVLLLCCILSGFVGVVSIGKGLPAAPDAEEDDTAEPPVSGSAIKSSAPVPSSVSAPKSVPKSNPVSDSVSAPKSNPVSDSVSAPAEASKVSKAGVSEVASTAKQNAEKNSTTLVRPAAQPRLMDTSAMSNVTSIPVKPFAGGGYSERPPKHRGRSKKRRHHHHHRSSIRRICKLKDGEKMKHMMKFLDKMPKCWERFMRKVARKIKLD